jgi:lipopolysaccharide transport system permease protein
VKTKQEAFITADSNVDETIKFVIDADRSPIFDWAEIRRYQELFYFFTWRDIKIKYKQTVLGFLWAVIQPLLMMIIFTLFFGKALKIPSQNLPYPVFVFSGLLIWNLFSAGLTNASNSLVNNATIIKKIYFPRLIIPVSSLMVALFDFFIAFTLFIPLLIFYKTEVSVNVFWSWPAALILSLVATLGPGSLLAALNVKYRDFRYVIPFIVQILFFLTPIVYPVTLLDYPVLKYILAFFPMYAAVELFRWPLTQADIQMDLMLISIFSGIGFLFIGLRYFKKTEDFFADFA